VATGAGATDPHAHHISRIEAGRERLQGLSDPPTLKDGGQALQDEGEGVDNQLGSVPHAPGKAHGQKNKDGELHQEECQYHPLHRPCMMYQNGVVVGTDRLPLRGCQASLQNARYNGRPRVWESLAKCS
jgi:hypothetical protein